MPQEADQTLIFLQADSKVEPDDQPFVVVVRSRDELHRWLHDCPPALQWIQVEGLLGEPEVWSLAAQGTDEVPLDVILSAPGSEFADLYRLVDVRSVRGVRVSMSAAPGFLKALKLAASLGLPVRLLPGQPSSQALDELQAALEFYLHDPMVEAPVEFFHSALAWLRGAPTASLWSVLEEDREIYLHKDINSPQPGFFATLVQEGGECATCPWQEFCEGYFKWPEASYSCEGMKRLLSSLQLAAEEIERDLCGYAAHLPERNSSL